MAKLYRQIRAPFERGAIHIAMGVIPRLPRRGILVLAEIGGRLGYYLNRPSQKIGRANLDIAFGNTKTRSEKNRILKASSVTMVRTLIDTFWFAHHPENRLPRYVELDDSSHALFDDQSKICITAHFGNWEIMGQMCGHLGVPLSSIARPVKNKTVDKYFIRAREATGQTIIPRQGALRKLLGLLRKNGKTGFLADQNTKESEGARWVDFFGLAARVTGAPALLSARTQTDIVMGFATPQPGGTYKIYTTHTLPAPDNTQDETLHNLTQKITAATEEEIRKHPEHWLWTYKRWRKIDHPQSRENYPFYAR